MNKQVKLALIGAGNRGQGIFGKYAEEMPHRVKFTTVVEPDKDKRNFFPLHTKFLLIEVLTPLPRFLQLK